MTKENYQMIKVLKLEVNNGQIEGLPKNPRFVKDERFEALRKSIEDAPEMLEYRTLLVYPHEKKYVVIAGNMRLRAAKELGFKELPCYVLPEDTPAEKLREYTIKDNLEFGNTDWDCLANEWNTGELQEWGMECLFLNGDDDVVGDDRFFDNLENKEKKEKLEKLTIEIPLEITEQKEEIKNFIIEALAEPYPGITVK